MDVPDLHTKGYHYLLNMQEDEFGIMPHWMKAQALPPSLAQAYDKGRKAEEFLFPWGEIIHTIYDDVIGRGDGQRFVLEDLLKLIQDRTANEHPEKIALQSDVSRESKQRTLEDFVISTLREANWLPKKKKFEKKGDEFKIFLNLLVATTLSDVGGSKVISKMTRELFKLQVMSSWLQSGEFSIRKKFFRARLWNAYADRGIAAAIDNYISKVQ